MLREWHPQAVPTDDHPPAQHQPSDERALRAIISAAHHAGQRVIVLNPATRFKNPAPSGVHSISLANYNRVLNLDTVAQTITVQAGIELSTLTAALAEHRLALPALDTTAEQTLIAALSTGTHGASLLHGSLSQRVVSMTLIDGTGQVWRASRTENPELFAAACVGLGCIGVLSTVTLHAVPAFQLALHSRRLPFSEAVAELPTLARANEYPELYWLIGSPYAVLRSLARTTEPSDPPPSYLADKLIALIQSRAYPLALGLAARGRPMTPLTNRIFRYVLFGQGERRVGPSHLFFKGLLPRHTHVIEYAVAIEQAQAALSAIEQLLRERRPPVQLLLDVRFSSTDHAWLSPSYGRESCVLRVLAYQPSRRRVPYQPWFDQLDQLFQALGGRPHWGTHHGASGAYLARCYPRWEAFHKVRRQIDPAGTLISPYPEPLLVRHADVRPPGPTQ